MSKLDLLALAQLPEDEQRDAIEAIARQIDTASEEERVEVLALLERIQELASQRARPN